MLNKNRTELSFVFSLSNGGRNTPLHPLIGVLSKHKEKGAAGDALKLGGVKRETKSENNFRWRNGIGGDWNRSREERWMKVDNRHYCPPAGVFDWMQSAVWVTHRHKDIYKTQIHTLVCLCWIVSMCVDMWAKERFSISGYQMDIDCKSGITTQTFNDSPLDPFYVPPNNGYVHTCHKYNINISTICVILHSHYMLMSKARNQLSIQCLNICYRETAELFKIFLPTNPQFY